ncbi:MAG: Flavodoxin-like protein fold family protein [Parcubacteria group bacterium GW2011_GWA2_40_23]|nr:MAG: Flavodoxin-like protein fold family protein [Parcubacteria group bacterium GW2011_GWA2_40_23]
MNPYNLRFTCHSEFTEEDKGIMQHMSKKILVINSNPAKESFGRALAEAYAAGAKEAGAEVQLLHLIDLKFDPILWGGDKSTQEMEPDLIKAQELIKWTDHLVIVVPVWWANVPALLKGFIDRVFTVGWAYKFTGPNKWAKYLTKKTSYFIITTGGPALYYRFLLRNPIAKFLGRDVLGFCGFGKYGSTIIGGLVDATPGKCKEKLKKIKNLGRKQT